MVDDEPGVCWVLATLLGEHGFVVVARSTGHDALAWCREHGGECRLALIDGKLPDIDGVDLAARIRGETGCAAPMIMMTGYFSRDALVVQNALHSGLITAFLTKPFKHEEMIGTVNKVLASGAAALVREPSPRR